jgi:hypothetical protein
VQTQEQAGTYLHITTQVHITTWAHNTTRARITTRAYITTRARKLTKNEGTARTNSGAAPEPQFCFSFQPPPAAVSGLL